MIAPRTDVSPEFLAQQGLSDNFPQRFWAKVFITPTHWLWEGARRPRGVIRNTFGHGTISRGIDKRVIQPHVASWLLHFGAIPEGKWVLHCCPGKHIPFCVNPEHLYLGDAKDNAADRMAQGTSPFFKGHTHVRRGEDNINHKLTPHIIETIRREFTGVHGEQTELARKYGVSNITIGHILSGKTWKHLNLPPHPSLIEMQERWKHERERPRIEWPPKGENNPNRSLTKEQVEAIRFEYSLGQISQTALAKKYGVRQPCIWKIVHHLIW